jgi:DNA-binding XRE family transcriptional regulator
MGQYDTQSAFKKGFLARTAKARINAGYTQEEIALLLNVPQDKYKHYERRSFLPHHLVASFCVATRCEIAWLYGMVVKRIAQPAPQDAQIHLARRANGRPSR